LKLTPIWHYQHSDSIDFSTAEYFTQKFAAWLLTNQVPFAYDVDVLKVDVPNDATPQTAWQLTRQARQRAYLPVPGRGASKFARRSGPDLNIPPDTDIYVGLVERLVSVTPLSLDLTSRTDFAKLQTWLRTS
jgi:5'-nucleotidase